MERKGNSFLLRIIWKCFRHGVRANFIFEQQLLMKLFDAPPLPVLCCTAFPPGPCMSRAIQELFHREDLPKTCDQCERLQLRRQSKYDIHIL